MQQDAEVQYCVDIASQQASSPPTASPLDSCNLREMSAAVFTGLTQTQTK
jgi:hypothetical protein